MSSQRRILIVDDDPGIRESLEELLQAEGYEVVSAADGRQALQTIEREPVALVLSDGQMQPMDGYSLLKAMRAQHPDIPVVMMSAFATVDMAVSAMRNQAAHYLVKPFSSQQLLELVTGLLRSQASDDGLVAEDPRSQHIKALAARVAGTDATVMLTGPSGAGKEVFARYIHQQSPRASGPFVAVNCAAIPENMLEAMLFGYEKGAFTGAQNSHTGKFEQAQGGTLLLDEISEMDLGLQAKLLRVLQERELERLGGKKTISLDLRVLATSNRDLRSAVANGKFREDLFYRLNVFPLAIPPLCERPGDILPLAEHFLRHGAGQGGAIALSASARSKLERHRWPGNVRELDNVMQRATILRSGVDISADDIQFELQGNDAGFSPEPADDAGEPRLDEQLKDRERKLISDALKSGGSKKEAAAILGISPRTLRYKLARLREENLASG